MATKTYQDISFFDIQKGDVVQMKRAGQNRFGKRIAVASIWNHEFAGRVLEGLSAKDKMIIESIDSKNQFRVITIK
jgi:hypothetical protein